jgi:hypothetical protein
MRGGGILADSFHQSLKIAKEKFFPDFAYPELNTDAFINAPKGQLCLF